MNIRKKIDWNLVTEKIKEVESGKREFAKEPWKELIFTPKTNEDGTYEAIIRFLPRPEDDGNGVPFVKLMSHGFQDVGGWFIENCLTTHNEQCPVCKENSIAWKAGKQEEVTPRSRRTSYYANILVVKDPSNPSNEGKVFIFRYGKKLQDKIMEKLSPPKGSVDEPVAVFDYYEGQNFKLKIKTIGNGAKKHKNYDTSTFTGVNTPVGNDEYIAKVDSMLHNLGQITDRKWFKTYDELEKKFARVIGKNVTSNSNTVEDDEDSDDEIINSTQSNPKSFNVTTSDDDSSDDFFASLRD